MEYNPEIIAFFKRHNMYDEKVFNYLQNNTMMIDYRNPDERYFIGLFYIQDKKERLQRIQLNIPYVYDYETALINVHEITHGIENYYKIGKKFDKDITVEALPLLYEKLYIMDGNNEELRKYGEYLDAMIDRDSEIEHRIALIEHYDYDMKKMQKLAKKLVRKYR